MPWVVVVFSVLLYTIVTDETEFFWDRLYSVPERIKLMMRTVSKRFRKALAVKGLRVRIPPSALSKIKRGMRVPLFYI